MTLDVRCQVTRGSFTLDAAFTVPGEGVTAIFGPSGCGKTTLLRAIAGLDRDASGRVALGDEVWQDDSRFVPTHRRALGYVFQEPSLFSHLNARENLRYGYRRVPENDRRVAFDDAVNLLGLNALLDRGTADLSGGERQRVAIARALLRSPKLLLMDEPLTALDARSKFDILPYLERLHAELRIPILYVSHDLTEVARLADHLVLMEAGRVQATGPLAEMLNRLDLPLAHAASPESIIETKVAKHDDEYELTELAFAAGKFIVPRVSLPKDHPVRVRVSARDVSITLAHQTGTSIQNILPAIIREIAEEPGARVTLLLDLGENTTLLSRITRRSAATLNLKPGQQVYAQVKTVALLGPAVCVNK